MNIALVHDWLTGFAGAERVLEQIASLYPQADIFTSVVDYSKIGGLKTEKIKTTFLQKIPLSRRKRQFFVPLMPLAFESLNLSKYDLVISNTSSMAKGVMTKVETPHICYCHTPTRYLWEPELDSRASDSRLKRYINNRLQKWDLAAAMRPDYYFANSKNIQEKIWKYYRRKSQVIYPPVDVGRFKIYPKNQIKDYYLSVGRLIPYKKVDLAVKAFNDLKKPLYIVGEGPEMSKLKKMAKGNIKFLGKVSDEEQVSIYGQAKAFVFPANEDFGLVPVEAMASGRPVIAFHAGGAMETVTEGITGTFFKEQSPQCLIETVREFNPDKYQPERLRQKAMDFNEASFRINFKSAVDKCLEDYKKNGPPIE